MLSLLNGVFDESSISWSRCKVQSLSASDGVMFRTMRPHDIGLPKADTLPLVDLNCWDSSPPNWHHFSQSLLEVSQWEQRRCRCFEFLAGSGRWALLWSNECRHVCN